MKTQFFQTSKVKKLTFVLAFACICLTTSCTKLRSGDTFTIQSNGINYRCEVIVSHQNYVRIIPVTGPEALRVPYPCPPPSNTTGIPISCRR